jgi:hypothetical protein
LARACASSAHCASAPAVGRQPAADGVDPSALTREITIASDALIVLMTYENQGYALLSF